MLGTEALAGPDWVVVVLLAAVPALTGQLLRRRRGVAMRRSAPELERPGDSVNVVGRLPE